MDMLAVAAVPNAAARSSKSATSSDSTEGSSVEFEQEMQAMETGATAEEGNNSDGNVDADVLLSPEALMLGLQSGQVDAEVLEQLKDKRLSLASASAADELAGPSPWNSEWVFEGLRGNPHVKPLAGNNQSAENQELLKQLLALAPQEGGHSRSPAPHPTLASSQVVGMPMMQDSSQLDGMAVKALPSDMLQNANAGAAEWDSKLQQLNGSMEGLKVTPGSAKAQTQSQGLAASRAVTQQNLSGQDFISTLNGIRSSGQSPAAVGGMNVGADGSAGEMAFQFAGGESSGGNLAHEQLLQAARSDAQASSASRLRPGSPQPFGISDFQSNVMQATQETNNVYEPSFAGASASRQSQTVPVVNVEGEVVKGALTMDRLSHAALENLSGSVQQLKQMGGGEIRLRLNPEHLGSLRLHVSTVGNQVGLQIEASDAAARRVLEDSMIYLKEKLSSQNLSLGRVELHLANHSVTSAHGSSNLSDSLYGDQGRGNLMNSGDSYRDLNQQQDANHSRQDSGDNPEWMDDPRIVGRGQGALSPRGLAAVRSENVRNNGRIDVRA